MKYHINIKLVIIILNIIFNKNLIFGFIEYPNVI